MKWMELVERHTSKMGAMLGVLLLMEKLERMQTQLEWRQRRRSKDIWLLVQFPKKRRKITKNQLERGDAVVGNAGSRAFFKL
jgi:hypothetical protein